MKIIIALTLLRMKEFEIVFKFFCESSLIVVRLKTTFFFACIHWHWHDSLDSYSGSLCSSRHSRQLCGRQHHCWCLLTEHQRLPSAYASSLPFQSSIFPLALDQLLVVVHGPTHFLFRFQEFLGSDFLVQNFGNSGKTMLTNGYGCTISLFGL